MAIEQVAPELAKFARPGAAPLQAPVVTPDQLENPLFKQSAEDIAEYYAANKKHSLLQFRAANRDALAQRPELDDKIIDAIAIIKDRGFDISDLSLREGLKSLGHMAKGGVQSLAAAGEQIKDAPRKVGLPIVSPLETLGGVAKAAGGMIGGKDIKSAFIDAFADKLPDKIMRKTLGEDAVQARAAADRKKEAELTSAAEAAQTGLVDLARVGTRKLADFFSGTEWTKLSPQEKRMRVEMDTEMLRTQQNITEGGGALTKFAQGGKVDVDPEKVGTMAAGDPLAFAAFGGVGKGLGTAARGAVRGAVKATPIAKNLSRAQQASLAATEAGTQAARAEGAAAQAATGARAAATEATAAGTPQAIATAERATAQSLAEQIKANAARAAQEAAQADLGAARAALNTPGSRAALGAINALKSAASTVKDFTNKGIARTAQGVAGAAGIGTGAAAYTAGKAVDTVRAFLAPIVTPHVLKTAATAGQRTGASLAKGGVELLKGKPQNLGLVGQFVNDLSLATADAAKAGAIGFTGDAAFAALTSEDPTTTQQMPLFMTALGAAGSAARGGLRIAAGQTVAPRAQRLTGAEFEPLARKSYSANGPLDQATQFSLREQPPEVSQRLGAIRSVVEEFGGEAHYIREPQLMIDALKAIGVDEATAQLYAQQGGVRFIHNNKPIVLLSELSAGPHEAGHAMQFVLSDQANQMLREGAVEQYGNMWDTLGQRYVDMLGVDVPAGRTWQEAIVEATGGPARGRSVEETANIRLADEIIAENFDTMMKARGTDLKGSKFQQVMMDTLKVLGASDIPLTESEVQGVPVTARSAEAVRKAAIEARQDFRRPDFTQPQRPIPGQENEAALLGRIADAIENQQAVSLSYRAAPGEPAGAPGSTRAQRRAIIEAFRQMPESARSLWERTFFPERVTSTSRGRQVIGWSPEVLAANAQKLAVTLSELQAKGVDVARLSPYEIDPTTRSFTPEAWQRLFEDAQTFSANQRAGRTGAGDPLVVPRSAQEAGAFAPPVTGEGTALPQNVADFHNLLFNFRLPNKPRITGGKMPLNVLGQDVSAATQPGRLRVPVEPKAPFTGEKAQALGIEGREILEVNPLRGQLEAEAKAAGVQMPSMVEVIQRLNTDRIADVQPNAAQAPVGRGNTLTLSAGFQPASRKFVPKDRPLEGTPKVGFGKHVWIDPQGKMYDAGGYHAEWAANQFGGTKKSAMSDLLANDWVRVNMTPGMGIFVEKGFNQPLKSAQRAKLEDMGFENRLPVLNKKGRVEISSTAEFQDPNSSFVFQPRGAGGAKWALKKPKGDRFSKAWILPNGEPVQLGEKWHWRYMKEKAGEMAKRFKMDPKALAKSEGPSRAEALRKGAVRINYDRGSGMLVIEATKPGWERNKAALEMFAMENIDKIDTVDISIFNQKLDRIIDGETKQIFRYEGPEKLAEFPMLFEDVRSTGSQRDRIGGLFQPAKPGETREHVKAAAVRWKPTGEVFEGPMHAIATDALLTKGIADGILGKRVRSFDELGDGQEWAKFTENMDDGFTTSTGRFVSRQEAADIARTADQLPAKGAVRMEQRRQKFGEDTGLDSQDVGREGFTAEAAPKAGTSVRAEAERLRTENLEPGFTNKAERMGKNLSKEDRIIAEAARDFFEAEYKKALESGDFDASMQAAAKRQFFREMVEAETAPTVKGHEGAQFQPRGRAPRKLSETVEEIKSGELEGLTLDRNGTEVRRYYRKPVDAVTLHSENFPVKSFSEADVQGVMDRWSKVLDKDDVVAGVFRLDGVDEVSVDVNAMVPKKYRDNTLAFAKENDQQAIFDMEKLDVVDSGGKGQSPKIESPEQAVAAAEALQKGEPFQFQPKGVEKKLEGAVPIKGYDIDVANPAGANAVKVDPARPVSLGAHLDSKDPATKAYVKKVVNSMTKIPGMRNIKGTTKQRYDKIVRHMADNFKRLWELSPDADKKVHSMWYWLANKMTHEWSKELSTGERPIEPVTVAAVNARMSPQKDWVENTSMTRRILELYKDDVTVKPEHADFTKAVVEGRKREADRADGLQMAENIRNNVGKKLSDLPAKEAGAVIRAENELFGDRKLYDHENKHVPVTESGRKRFVWQSYKALEDVVSMLRDPSIDNLSNKLGNNHKVRAFFMNHVNPENSTALPVTMDTHAGAGATMLPLGSKSPEIKQLFGTPKALGVGYSGTYPIYADAIRLAARELGVDLPLQVQSVTWERIRRLMSPSRKRTLQKSGEAADVWKRYEDGEISQREAQDQIVELFKTKTGDKGQTMLDL